MRLQLGTLLAIYSSASLELGILGDELCSVPRPNVFLFFSVSFSHTYYFAWFTTDEHVDFLVLLASSIE